MPVCRRRRRWPGCPCHRVVRHRPVALAEQLGCSPSPWTGCAVRPVVPSRWSPSCPIARCLAACPAARGTRDRALGTPERCGFSPRRDRSRLVDRARSPPRRPEGRLERLGLSAPVGVRFPVRQYLRESRNPRSRGTFISPGFSPELRGRPQLAARRPPLVHRDVPSGCAAGHILAGPGRRVAPAG